MRQFGLGEAQHGIVATVGRQLGPLRLGLTQLAPQAGDPAFEFRDLAVERRPARLVGGDAPGDVAVFGLELTDRGVGRGKGPGHVPQRVRFAGLRRLDVGGLGGEPGKGARGVPAERLFALGIRPEVGKAGGALLLRCFQPPLLGLKFAAGEGQALQLCRRLGLRLAQLRQGAGLAFACVRRHGDAAGELGDLRLLRREPGARLVHAAVGSGPAQMQYDGLGAPDAVGDGAVAFRLARLLLQALELVIEGLQHVVETLEIGLGRAQAQLRLMPARMQAGDAGRLLEQQASPGRLGRDEGADAALAHQGGGACTGGQVGEHHLHVAGAHLAAIDAVVRALVALDTARHLDLLVVVELGGRGARAVVQRQSDFGDIARRAVGGAIEDDIVHLAAAHLLRRGFAHRPSERLDNIRLAAAVGTDDARQSRRDDQLRGIDETLEAGQPEFGELHRWSLRQWLSSSGSAGR